MKINLWVSQLEHQDWIGSELETVEFWQQVKTELVKHGIEIEITMNGEAYYELISLPEGMADEEYGQLLFEVCERLRPKAGALENAMMEVPEDMG